MNSRITLAMVGIGVSLVLAAGLCTRLIYYTSASNMPNRSQAPPIMTAIISNDNGTVYYDSYNGYNPAIMIAPLSTIGQKATTKSLVGMHPRVARKGATLFFERRSKEGVEIALIGEDNDIPILLHQSEKDISIRDIDESGSRLIFSTKHFTGGMGVAEEFAVLNTQTLGVSKLPGAGSACFVRDGCIVYSIPRTQEIKCKVLGGGVHHLARGGYPTSSVDGMRVLYVTNPNVPLKQRNWKVLDLQSRHEFNIGLGISPVLSADGADVVFLSPNYDWTVWMHNIESGSREQIGQLDAPIAGFASTAGGVSAICLASPLKLAIVDVKNKSLRQIPVNSTSPPSGE